MVSNDIKRYPIVLNGTQWYQMVTNGVPNCTQWYQIVPNGIQWYQIVPNGIQWYHTSDVFVPVDLTITKLSQHYIANQNISKAWKLTHLVVPCTCFIGSKNDVKK